MEYFVAVDTILWQLCMFTVHVHVYPQLFRIPLWEFYFQSFAFKQTPARQIDTIGTVISTRRDGIENGLCTVNVLYTVCMYCTMFACTVQCLHVLYNVCMYCTMFACTVQCLHVLYKCAVYMYRMVRATTQSSA